MTTIYIYAFASVIIVSLVSLVGSFFLSLREDILKKYVSLFISLAIETLLRDGFIDFFGIKKLIQQPPPFGRGLFCLFLLFYLKRILASLDFKVQMRTGGTACIAHAGYVLTLSYLRALLNTKSRQVSINRLSSI